MIGLLKKVKIHAFFHEEVWIAHLDEGEAIALTDLPLEVMLENLFEKGIYYASGRTMPEALKNLADLIQKLPEEVLPCLRN